MSKLPNAPLVEVIFELHWPSTSPDDINKFEMCLGTVFSDLKQHFPKIIHLRPDTQIPLMIFIDKPTHRFTSGEAQGKNHINYPIYQLGPGLLTVNTIDEKYDWRDFSKLIISINDSLSKRYPFDPNIELTLVLKYLDFYNLNFSQDIRASYHNLFKFNIDLGPAVPKDTEPILLNIESAYKSHNGTVNFSLKRGKMTRNEENLEGIVFESSIQTKIKAENYADTLTQWLKDSHEDISTFFKVLTEGPTYESFKQKNYGNK